MTDIVDLNPDHKKISQVVQVHVQGWNNYTLYEGNAYGYAYIYKKDVNPARSGQFIND